MEHPIDLSTILQAEASEAASLHSSCVRHCVRSTIMTMMREEVEQLCGPAYNPSSESSFFRAGSAPTTIYADGKPVSTSRPRVRELTEDGTRELTLNGSSTLPS